jgi:uncharacterized protein YjaG (DUF416 family)
METWKFIKKRKVDENTIFESISKIIYSLILVDEGKINWDDTKVKPF